MRVVVWITESTWEACVDQSRTLLPPATEVTLLHVSPSDVEELASHGAESLLGRRPRPAPGPPLRAVAREEGVALLTQARERLGLRAELIARSGRVEREVVAACVGADLLVLARDGKHRLGPPSLGPRARFVVDHAPCQVLLVWAHEPPGLETLARPRPEAGRGRGRG